MRSMTYEEDAERPRVRYHAERGNEVSGVRERGEWRVGALSAFSYSARSMAKTQACFPAKPWGMLMRRW